MIEKEVVQNNLRFPGQYFDSESELYYIWNRFYDPSSGRCITADPTGLEGGINLYVYTLNNPINRADPYGLDTWRGGIGEIDLFVGLIGGSKMWGYLTTTSTDEYCKFEVTCRKLEVGVMLVEPRSYTQKWCLRET